MFIVFSFAATAMLVIAGQEPGNPRVIDVADDEALRAALPRLGPGDTLRIAPGTYRGGLYVTGPRGLSDAPVTIEALDPTRPPLIQGGREGLHLVRPEHAVLRHLVVRGAEHNGINIDDGGDHERPALGLLLEHLIVEETGPTGNKDALKLSGVRDFTVRASRFSGWGGSAIDMVACSEGLIESCRFEGLEGYTSRHGVQAKGGSHGIVLRDCDFEDAGLRAVHIGGSTRDEVFRDAGADCEARDVTVEGCRFRGSQAPIAFVGADAGRVRYNTFYRPRRFLLRILQERTEPRFVRCRDGLFERNLIVFRRDELKRFVNVGDDTLPGTFAFRGNWWFAEDGHDPGHSRPELPSLERGSVFGLDPGLGPDLRLTASSGALGFVGAESLPPQASGH